VSFLLDADTCSAHLKGVAAATSKFLQYTGQLHISTLTVGELYTWAMRASAPPRRLQTVTDLLDDTAILDVDLIVGQKFGEIRAGLLDIGRPAPSLDLFLAATALVHDLTLVTHNVQDFQNVPGLRIQDWLAP
jgi:predicted nucleic acid-binding protein